MAIRAHDICLRQAPFKVHIPYDPSGLFRGEGGAFDATVTSFGKDKKTGKSYIILAFKGKKLAITPDEWDSMVKAEWKI